MLRAIYDMAVGLVQLSCGVLGSVLRVAVVLGVLLTPLYVGEWLSGWFIEVLHNTLPPTVQ